MFFFPRAIGQGSMVPATLVRQPFILSSLLLLLTLPAANAECTTDPNNTAVEQCPPSSSSQAIRSGLPTAVILTIVAAALFVLMMTAIWLYFYIRKRRERKKRDEYRWKVWQFKDMERSRAAGPGSQPPLPATRTFQSSEITLVPSRLQPPQPQPAQMSDVAIGPQHPAKIYGPVFAGQKYGAYAV